MPLDFVSSLPPSEDNTVKLIGSVSEVVNFMALPKLPTATKTVQLIVQCVLRLHRIPSERGTLRFGELFCEALEAKLV